MKLDDVIGDIERNILSYERYIDSLKSSKLKFQKIKEQYPSAQLEGRSICLDGIWDRITCMRIEYKYKGFNSTKIVVKFLLGKKHSIEGMKMYTLPFESEIAEISPVAPNPAPTLSSPNKKRERQIRIVDFKSLIPTECPRRNSFIKRIKFHLVDVIAGANLIIDPTSHDKDMFDKLIMLR